MKNFRFEKSIALLTALYPILIQYKSGIPGVSLGDLIIALLIVYDLIFGKKKYTNFNRFTPNLTILIPIITLFILTSINMIVLPQVDLSQIIVRLLRFIIYLYIGIVLLPRYLDFSFFMDIYVKLIWFSVLFLLVQVIFFNVFNIVIFGVVPNWGIGFDIELIDKYNRHFVNFYRPASFFIEPGYFARFLIPYLVYLFYPPTKINHRYLRITLILMALLLSTSGQGIIISGILILSKILRIIFNTIITLRIKIEYLLLFILLPLGFSILSSNELLIRSVGRLFGSETASSNTRIISGFRIWSNSSFSHKMIGHGFGNSMSPYANGLDGTYMNSIAYLLNNAGILGLFSFFPVFIARYKSSTLKFEKAMIIVFIILSTSSSLFIYSGSVFYLAIIFTKKYRR